MLISHEVPPALFTLSLKFNDYDYFLIHLMEKNHEYVDFYNVSKSLGRMQILDNSACELRGKEEFDFDRFAHYVELYEPTEYLIPDVFNNFEKNIEYFDTWMYQYSDLPGKKIATVHGTTYEEFVKSYEHFLQFSDVKIAFNFDEVLYDQYKVWPGDVVVEPKTYRRSNNRKRILRRMLEDQVINTNREHHLLGCHVANEYQNYTGPNWSWITSIDTSNPIMMTLANASYSDTVRNDYKPSIRIDDPGVQGMPIEKISMNLLHYNVNWFRQTAGSNPVNF